MSAEGNDLDEFASNFSRFYILTLLYEQPQHGYGIISLFKKRLGKVISSGLVYPFLQDLENKGIIEYELELVGDKKKKKYKLTTEGKELSERLFKRFAGLIAVAINSTIKVCVHCGCKIYEGAYTENIGGKDISFCCMHCASSYKQTRKEDGKKPLFS